MTISIETVETGALSLSLEDRARLVKHLLESIDERPGSDPQQVERDWLAEAACRYEAYLRGEEQTITAEDVFTELRADDR
ncbi:MAG: addiction module protein [Methylophaga sp.]|nr:addiction module protein [Methylophaga sp.]